MNLNLFLIILIALIIIFCIILYNGLRVILAVEKEKSIARYEFKVTMLKIPIFKRAGAKGKDISEDSASDKDLDSKKEKTDAKTKEESEEETKSEEKESYKETKTEEKESDKKGFKEKFNEIKPILKEVKNSKRELKKFLKDVLKSIDIKKLEGHLTIGLTDHTTTVKIASWIWSIGAIVNSNKSSSLTVDPKFTEQILDFEGNLELKINLLKLIIFSLILVTKKNIRELIKVVYKYKKDTDKKNETSEEEFESKEEKPTKEESKPKEEKLTKEESKPEKEKLTKEESEPEEKIEYELEKEK